MTVCPSYLLWRPPTVSLPGASLWSTTTTSSAPCPLDVAMVSSSSSFQEGQHFQVVLAAADKKHQALACVYSSKTGLWGNPISTPLPYEANGSHIPTMVHTEDAVLAGDSLYWMFTGSVVGILEFDLVKQSLAVIHLPVDIYSEGRCFRMMRAEGGGLGFLFVPASDHTAQLWKRKTDCDGSAPWMLVRTIELDKVLSLKPEEKGPLFILGFAEENNVVFLWTMIGLFMINLETLEFKNLFKTMFFSYYHPFESVYAAGACVGGGNDGAELLLST